MSNNQDPIFAANSARRASQRKTAALPTAVAGEGAYATNPHNSGVKREVAPGTIATATQAYMTWTGTKVYDWQVDGLNGDWSLGGNWSVTKSATRKQGSGMGKRVANELCPTCHGAGSMAHTASSQPCRTCRGEGLIARTAEWDGASCKSCGKNNFPDARRCAHCGVPHPGDAPVGKKKKASRRTAVSLTNVGFEGGIGGNMASGYTADGRKVTFRLSDQDAKDLANVMTSDMAINFSGVDVDEADIISTSSRRTAADVTPNENGEKTLRNGWVNMKGEGKVFRPDLAQLLIDMAKADSGLLSEGGRRDSHPLVPSTEDFCRDMVARGEPWVSECPNPFCRDGVHLECSGIQCDCPCHAFGFNEMGFLSSRKTAGYRYMTADEVARWRAGEYFPGAEEDANGVLFSVTDPDMGDFGLGDDDDPAMILASRRTADQNFGPAPDSQSGFGESERDWVTVDNATDDSNLGWISNEPEEAYEMDPGFGPFDDID